MRKIVLTLIIIGMMGCASVPMDSHENDAKRKQFVPNPDKAGLYIYRNENFGAAVTMTVSVDGKDIGKTAAKTYLFKEVDPGEHEITSKAENSDTMNIDAVAGKLYYFWQEVKWGMISARSQLHQVDEEQGQKGVSESKLAITK